MKTEFSDLNLESSALLGRH